MKKQILRFILDIIISLMYFTGMGKGRECLISNANSGGIDINENHPPQ